MNIKNAHLFLEDLELDDRVQEVHNNPNNHACYSCEVDHSLTDEGFPFCHSCGVVNFDRPEMANEVVDVGVKQRVVSLYKRRLYVREKLNLMAGYKQSCSKQYKEIIASLKKNKVRNIIHLKQMLKDRGLKKFYKHIYNIYFDLKRIRLIKLSYNEVDFLAKKFIEAETKFKDNNHDRSNFFSYSSVICMLLKKYKMVGYRNLILPLNHLQISSKIRTLI